jgi:glutathione synthase/RimK-type ligase-like ATP-grasp enzyme
VKIGLLVGREETFPRALIDRINSKNVPGVTAEMARLAGTRTDDPIPYKVIVDRISHEIYYYRAYLKKAVLDGTIVINNPFWWAADDKFFENVLAQKLGVAVPKTIVIPSREYTADIIDESLRNLVRPFPWEEWVDYVGFPAVLKPAIGGGNKNIHIVNSMDELLQAYDQSGDLLMVLEECIEYENYVRCWVFGGRHVQVSRYNHRLPRAERYVAGFEGITSELQDRIVQDCLTLNQTLGYDMNTVEMAIRDGIPYAIDFLNPAPDCDLISIGPERFEWVVETMANLTIAYATGEETPAGGSIWPDVLRSASRIPVDGRP